MPPEQGETWRDTKTRTGSGRHEAASSTVAGLTILAHSDVQRVGERVALLDLASGREERLSRLEPAFAAPGEPAQAARFQRVQVVRAVRIVSAVRRSYQPGSQIS